MSEIERLAKEASFRFHAISVARAARRAIEEHMTPGGVTDDVIQIPLTKEQAAFLWACVDNLLKGDGGG